MQRDDKQYVLVKVLILNTKLLLIIVNFSTKLLFEALNLSNILNFC